MNRRLALDKCWKTLATFAGSVAALALIAPRAGAYFYYFRWRVVVHRHRRRFRRWKRR